MRILKWLICCLIGHDYSVKAVTNTEIDLVYITICDRCDDGWQHLDEAKYTARHITGE